MLPSFGIKDDSGRKLCTQLRRLHRDPYAGSSKVVHDLILAHRLSPIFIGLGSTSSGPVGSNGPPSGVTWRIALCTFITCLSSNLFFRWVIESLLTPKILIFYIEVADRPLCGHFRSCSHGHRRPCRRCTHCRPAWRCRRRLRSRSRRLFLLLLSLTLKKVREPPF